MQNVVTLKRHADLVDRMARTLGIDLEERMMAGKLRPGEVNDAVLACTGCAASKTCAQWLERTREAGATPDYCRNADLFSRLRLDGRG